MMFNPVNTSNADQLHANGRQLFGDIARRARQLQAAGLDEPLVVGRLVAQVGAGIMDTLGAGDEDRQFWAALWQVTAALAYAAVNSADVEQTTE